ncbi:MAG: hypothetical protein ABR591_00525 [Candidatus Velthaea sp.]
MLARLSATPLLALAIAAGAFARGAAQTPAPQPTPSPIVVPTLPPSASSGPADAILRSAAGIVNDILGRERARAANSARGTVTYFKRFDMQVQMGTNSYRTIHLHQGTVINPRGATPSVGTNVDITGQNLSDGSLDAGTITILR